MFIQLNQAKFIWSHIKASFTHPCFLSPFPLLFLHSPFLLHPPFLLLNCLLSLLSCSPFLFFLKTLWPEMQYCCLWCDQIFRSSIKSSLKLTTFPCSNYTLTIQNFRLNIIKFYWFITNLSCYHWNNFHISSLEKLFLKKLFWCFFVKTHWEVCLAELWGGWEEEGALHFSWELFTFAESKTCLGKLFTFANFSREIIHICRAKLVLGNYLHLQRAKLF